MGVLEWYICTYTVLYFQCLEQTLLNISEELAMKLVKADEDSEQYERELMK